MLNDGEVVAFDASWVGSFRGRSAYVVRDGQLLPAEQDAGIDSAREDLRVPGTLFYQLTDHHVHLGLIDPSPLLSHGVTHVIDLGGNPAELGRLRTDARDRVRLPSGRVLPEIHFAGTFLTCVGGYPAGRPWAPADSVLELGDPGEAEAAVWSQVAAGASVIKVALNSAAGPVPTQELLVAIVTAARAEGVPVVAHVEGEGMTERALDAGVNVLAHAPFTERLAPELVARLSRAGTTVISTLAIHDRDDHVVSTRSLAVENVRHLAAAGVRILYGTDLGNGELPPAVNVSELLALAEAGLDREALVGSIAGTSRTGTHYGDAVGPRLAWVPGTPPDSAERTARWLASARGCTIDDLEETLYR